MKTFRVGIVMLAVLMLLLASMLPATAALSWKSIQERFPALLTAGENITIGQAVCIKAADGYAYKADSNDSALRPCIGFAERTTASGAKIGIVTRGQLQGMSTLTKGAPVYLSETAGGYVVSAPTNVQEVGVAITATTMQVRIAPINADLGALADTKVWIGDGSSVANPYALSGDATMTNAGVVTVTAATGAFTVGGGYGSTGTTLSTAGVGQFNGALTTDGALTALSAAIGGGYGASGCDIAATGNIQTNGTLTVDSTTTLTGALTAGVLTTVNDATATRVSTSGDYGKTIFLNYAGAVAVTLPANGAAAGSWIRYIVDGTDSTAPTIAAATTDTLIGPNDVDLKSITFGSGHRIGACVRFISNGTYWIAVNEGSTTMTAND